MKLAHYFCARVKISNKEEDEKTLRSLILLSDPKDELKVTEDEGFLKIEIKRDSDCNSLLRMLKKRLSAEDRATLAINASDHVDDHLDFFLKLDRKLWDSNQQLALTHSMDGIYFLFNLAAFPKKQERGIAMVREMFKSDEH